MCETDKLMKKLLEKIEEANILSQNCVMLSDKNGYQKLRKKIDAELKFLKKLCKHPDRLKEEHLRSSNLHHLSSIVNCSLKLDGVTEVLKPYSYLAALPCGDLQEMQSFRIVVDVIADYGRTWVKVVARNPQALLQSSLGVGSFGRRTLCEQVEDLLSCAAQNPHLYHTPNVKVWFAAGITIHLKKIIENMGVEVLTQVIHNDCFLNFSHDLEDCTEEADSLCSSYLSSCNITPTQDMSSVNEASLSKSSSFLSTSDTDNSKNASVPYAGDLGELCVSENLSDKSLSTTECVSSLLSQTDDYSKLETSRDSLKIPDETPLNLDVSTMIAYVSALTNGRCNFQFKEKVLANQAEREKKFPVKKVLDKLFTGHQLLCCETAYKDFQNIISTLGGEGEKQRAVQLFSKVSIVPDQPSKYALSLHTSSKVRKRSQIIFGTGDSLKALTVTANGHFLRAAESQGIKFVAFVHESRALTEGKEE